MSIELLHGRLNHVVRRIRWFQLARRLAACWGIAALVAAGLLVLERTNGATWPAAARLLAVFTILATALVISRHRRSRTSIRHVAERLELAHPDLKGLVLTAAQQEAAPGQELGWLQQRVVLAAIEHDSKHGWRNLVPASRLVAINSLMLATLAVCVGMLWYLRSPGQSAAVMAAAKAAGGSGVEVTPGDISLERGFNLVVLARFGGTPPPGVELVYQPAGGAEQRVPLVKSLADPLFGGSVTGVNEDLAYHVEYAGARSRDFKVTVYEHPRLERADADLNYPTYTALPPKRIEDTHRVSAVEGTQLELALQLNKPVVSATLVARGHGGADVPLTVETNRAAASLRQFALATNATYDLRLVDDAGRTNKVPATFVFDVFANRPPEMKLASPRGDSKPSALEEVAFEGTVWDDFGVSAYGLAFTQVGKETQYVELGRGVTAREKRPFQHVLRLEDLGVQPGEVVAWFVWADDVGPDGAVRRNAADLFFGEVRPFEQVFREGQGGGGEGGEEAGQGNGSPTAKLAELQKQIINATWKLKRVHGDRPGAKNDPAKPAKDQGPSSKGAADLSPPAERGVVATEAGDWSLATTTQFSPRRSQFFAQRAGPDESTAPPRRARAPRTQPAPDSNPLENPKRKGPASYEDDLEVVREAAQQAIDQARATMERQQNPSQQALWNSAITEMERSLKELGAAAKSPAALAQALVAEQAAYQALLKLQDGERQVTRGRNRSQSQGQGAQTDQQQLEQLDLTQEQDRYETQRQARAPQNAQQREQLQVLNRLQELARRQQDLNDRLKELQTALPEARTEAEREELKRQLKRLQDEQRQMLADVDELRQRMDRPENQSRFSEERKELEQTRDDVQRAADAAGQGSVSQALASGTRAQRQLQEMRDDLRKQSSGEFTEELRQMRAGARELERKQEEISRQLGALDAPKQKSLSDASAQQAVMDQLAQQRQRLTNLVEKAGRISELAETSEPLVSQKLYDTLRKFNQDDGNAVKQAREELLRRGMLTRGLNQKLEETAKDSGAKSLELTSEMVRQGYLPEAGEAGQRAQAGINQLAQGVEQAAESVLGDDTEALRRARDELQAAADDIQREMAREQAAAKSEGQQPGASPGAGEGQSPGDKSPDSSSPQTAQANQPGQGRQPGEGKQPGQGNQADQANQPGEGNQPGQGKAGDQAGQGRQPGQQNQPGQPNPAEQAGQQPGQGNQPGRGQSPGNQPGRGRPGTPQETGNASPQEQAGNEPQGDNPPANPADAQNGQGRGQTGREATARNSGRPGQPRDAQGEDSRRGGFNLDDFAGGGRSGGGPISGGDYATWSDRLREVEEILDQPDLRNDVAQARGRARELRQDFRRNLKKPDWAVVQLQVVKPLVEVRSRINDELARRQSREALVPIDRDPVPDRFSELVRRYYEELGRDK